MSQVTFNIHGGQKTLLIDTHPFKDRRQEIILSVRLTLMVYIHFLKLKLISPLLGELKKIYNFILRYAKR